MERTDRPMRDRRPRRKVCAFCVDKIETIDYKDVPRLRRYRPPPRHRHLRPASAAADRRHQARPPSGAAPLRQRLIFPAPSFCGGGFFCAKKLRPIWDGVLFMYWQRLAVLKAYIASTGLFVALPGRASRFIRAASPACLRRSQSQRQGCRRG